eukprot:gb/GECG01000102.1/.p1 GENE.gb/GECG01000102.1/~~gb/GECG01000102.1/.p1  ORF type:complete len:294 (+),score=61.71 gb/GECG01000102.1/:1-882(+)
MVLICYTTVCSEDNVVFDRMERSRVPIIHPERTGEQDEESGLTLEQRLELRKAKGLRAQPAKHSPSTSLSAGEATRSGGSGSNATELGSGASTTTAKKRDREGHESVRKRKDKHEPTEMPSNRPVSSYREVVDAPKRVRRDPRFEETAGTLHGQKFRKAYKFLDENAESEIQTLQKQLKKEKNERKRENMQRRLTRLKQQLREAQKSDRIHEVKNRLKKEEEKKVETGKKPFYLKRKDIKELALIDRYDELKKKGPEALDKAIEKKRKKNRKKDSNRTPWRQAQAVAAEDGGS